MDSLCSCCKFDLFLLCSHRTLLLSITTDLSDLLIIHNLGEQQMLSQHWLYRKLYSDHRLWQVMEGPLCFDSQPYLSAHDSPLDPSFSAKGSCSSDEDGDTFPFSVYPMSSVLANVRALSHSFCFLFSSLTGLFSSCRCCRS